MKNLQPFLFCILTLCIQLYASPVPQTNSTSDGIGPSDEEGNPYEVWGAGNATSVGNQTDAYTGNPYDLWGPGNITAGNNSDNGNNDNTAVGVDFDNTLQAIFLVAMIGILAIIGVGVFVKYKVIFVNVVFGRFKVQRKPGYKYIWCKYSFGSDSQKGKTHFDATPN